VITLSTTQWQTFLRLRTRRYSDSVLKYDPGHPVFSVKQEKDFWEKEIEKGLHLIWDINYKRSKTIGFIHAFNFEHNTCETGISILFHKYRNRGYGYAAYQLLFHILKHMDISSTYIWTNTLNIPAIALYIKLGYTLTGKRSDDGVIWAKYIRYL